MDFRKYIISVLYFPFRLVSLFSNIFKTNSFRLRIILMHDIPKDSHENLSMKENFSQKLFTKIQKVKYPGILLLLLLISFLAAYFL